MTFNYIALICALTTIFCFSAKSMQQPHQLVCEINSALEASNTRKLSSILRTYKHKAVAARLNEQKESMLHIFAKNNNPLCLIKALQHCINPNIQDHEGNTPLHLAGKNNHDECVKLLIEHQPPSIPINAGGEHTSMTGKKTRINAQNKDGNTALHLAVICGYWKTAELLLNNHASAEIKNNAHQTVFNLIGDTYSAAQPQGIVPLYSLPGTICPQELFLSKLRQNLRKPEYTQSLDEYLIPKDDPLDPTKPAASFYE